MEVLSLVGRLVGVYAYNVPCLMSHVSITLAPTVWMVEVRVTGGTSVR